MRRLLGIFCVIFLSCIGTARAFDDWTILENQNGRVLLAACANTLGSSVVAVSTPAYAIGGESLDSWFSTQIQARVFGWSGQYPSARPQIVKGAGPFLTSEVTFTANGKAWAAVFFANGRQGQAQWAVVLGSLMAAEIDGHFAEARQAMQDTYASGVMQPRPTVQPQPVPSFENAKPIGVLRSTSAKWLLNGSLTDDDRRYVLFDSGAAVEIAPPSAEPIATGAWAKVQSDFQIGWADGSVEAISGTCFSPPPTSMTTVTNPSSSAPATSGGSTGTGQNCHTETKLMTTNVFHVECFPPPCRQVMGPVTAEQEIEVCD